MENKSYSQLSQDLGVLQILGNKRNGFFVEAGAMDGLHLSNTLLLEREYGWTGICCEPNKNLYEKLQNNRNCLYDDGVLYNTNDEEIEFFTADGTDMEQLGGTFEDFKAEESRISTRTNGKTYILKTLTLNTLLKKHNAPRVIDYISLDTEGSELKILEEFDFDKWDVKVFTIEHNTAHRNDGTAYIDALKELLCNKHGYTFVNNHWDSFFTKNK